MAGHTSRERRRPDARDAGTEFIGDGVLPPARFSSTRCGRGISPGDSAAMQKTLALSLALVGTLALGCAFGPHAAKKAPVPREYAAKQLNAANKALKAKDLAGARKALIELESSKKANAF